MASTVRIGVDQLVPGNGIEPSSWTGILADINVAYNNDDRTFLLIDATGFTGTIDTTIKLGDVLSHWRFEDFDRNVLETIAGSISGGNYGFINAPPAYNDEDGQVTIFLDIAGSGTLNVAAIRID